MVTGGTLPVVHTALYAFSPNVGRRLRSILSLFLHLVFSRLSVYLASGMRCHIPWTNPSCNSSHSLSFDIFFILFRTFQLQLVRDQKTMEYRLDLLSIPCKLCDASYRISIVPIILLETLAAIGSRPRNPTSRVLMNAWFEVIISAGSIMGPTKSISVGEMGRVKRIGFAKGGRRLGRS